MLPCHQGRLRHMARLRGTLCETIEFAEVFGSQILPEMNGRIRVGLATDLSLTSA